MREIRTSSDVVCIAEQSARAWVAGEGAEVQANCGKFGWTCRPKVFQPPVSSFRMREGKQKRVNPQIYGHLGEEIVVRLKCSERRLPRFEPFSGTARPMSRMRWPHP